MSRNKSLIALVFLFASGTLYAAAGKTGLGFLSLGNGARSIGMGEAQTADAEASNAVYWNPAGLGITPFPEFTLTHAQLFEDESQQYAALAAPLKKGEHGTIGFSATRLAISDIQSRDAQSTLTGATVQQEDLNLQVSYGFRVGGHSSERDGLYLGAGAKRISEKLADVSASAYGFDVGGQYRPGEAWADRFGEWTRRLSLGIAALNLGKGPTFDKEETPLPQTTCFGAAYTHFLWGDALTLASDYEIAKNGNNRIMGGAEFWVKNMLALRAGYVQGQDVGDEIRFGAGFRFQTLQLDYALARFGSALGATHRFTLTMRFGEGAVKTATGLKPDLVKYYLSQAQEELAAGSYHDAVINANNVLEIDPRNTQALQILFDAGQKAKEPGPLPEVKPESTQPIPPVDHLEVVPQQETPSPAAPAQKPEEIKTEPSAPSEQPTGAPAAQPESKPAEAAPQAPPAQNNPTPAPEPEKKGEPKP